MSYVTSFEHIALKKGLQQVRQEGILLIARNLLKHNAPLSLIKSVTRLSEQKLNLEKEVEEQL